MDNNQQQNNQQNNQQFSQEQYEQQYNQQQYNQQYNQQQYDTQQQYYQQQYDMQQQYYQQQYAQQPQQVYQQNINQPVNDNFVGLNNDGSSDNGSGGKKKTGLIIGIIAALVIIAVVITVIVVKNKKDDKSDKDDKTTENITTEAKLSTEEITAVDDTTEDVDASTEEVADNVNHDPTNGMDYVPENPIIVDNEVMTIEITNIHHADPNADEFEDTHYRWDMKVTNNRSKGGIWVYFYFARYNGVEIGYKELNSQSKIARGQTRDVSIVWLDEHSWDCDYSGFSPDPSSLEFIATAKDEDYLYLLGEDVAFYPYGQENAVSDVPDLSALTPMIDYEGVKFYITRVNTMEEDNDTICLKGFVVNDSDLAYDFSCWGDQVTVNGMDAFGNFLDFDLYPHSVHYFQGWMDLPEDYYIYDGEEVEIGMAYELRECYMDKAETWRNPDKLDPVVEGIMFKCVAPAIRTEMRNY